MLKGGDWVWLDSDKGVPIGARVTVTASGQRYLVSDEGKEQRLSREQEASLRIMHPSTAEGVDDMIELGDLTEADLLRNLQLRHKKGIIYTYIGSVLVAVNPYQDFPIYSNEQVRLYHDRKLGELPPHIFAIAETCYSNILRYRKSQCCIISGETGAGKTESSKLILQYLAAVSGELCKQQIEQQILESNPILEAFGNAKTILNDNSSRFGKYLEIIFNKNGVIEGARMEQYLLEKSRVCHQAPEERNYHIFYCMLAGITAEEKKSLSLGRAKEYSFLNKGGSTASEGRNDAKDFSSIRSALKTLTFSEMQYQEILKLLAAILHLGNISFKANTLNNLDTSDVSKSQHFSMAASLLGVHQSSLAASFTSRSVTTNKESVTKPLSSEQAADSRDAFVKAIYNKLFIWIVEKINSVTYKKVANRRKSSFRSIGLLDIFGFENFDTNSFEQLCINFANETLQQFFVNTIFKQEQEEYLKEGIKWKKIEFIDNQNILDLLGMGPCNLLALIDEESHFPKGTDETMLQKINREHRGNKAYIPPKNEYDMDFGIHHFAGVVHYESKGFLEKNRDTVSFDVIKMVGESTSKLLRDIFETELLTKEVKVTSNKKVIMTPKSSLRAQVDNYKHVPTLSGQFRQSLDTLMKTLSACQPFFIRCIKPNNNKRPEAFDRGLCMRQLKYSGIMDTVHIRKQGYPVRHTFEDFLQRYRVLLRTSVCNPKTETAAACCKAICKAVIKKKDNWKKGRTKIFLRDACDTVLERRRERELNKKALVIQRTLRGGKDRISFLKKRRAALVLQRRWRAYRDAILPLKKLLHGLARLTARIRGRRLQAQFQRRRAAAVIIQSQVRGYWARKEWRRKRDAAILLQNNIRSLQARRKAEMLRSNRRSYVLEDDDKEDSFDDSSDEFSFYKFSLRHFQNNATHKHVSERLGKPLLAHDDEGDILACLSVSWMILRYMEDLPEPEAKSPTRSPTSPISRHLPRRQARKLSNLVERDRKILKRETNFEGERGNAFLFSKEQETEDWDFWIEGDPVLDRPLSSMEKIHIIIENALLRRDIRDEIYCQICKQLVNNKSKRSQMRGWTLLSICLGIFPPTELFMMCLESFVQRGPNGYAKYCTERLSRIKSNGERKEVPSRLEIQAAKSKEPIDVSVTLTDGRAVSLRLDSASTSAEVCQAVADRIDLRDTFGFSLYISHNDEMSSLGCGRKHVFDAVSECEQEMRRQGEDEKDAPWRLCFRKELFTPWHDCSVDPISTDLIYRQVIKGLKTGVYTSEKEDEYVNLAAKHYYMRFGPENNKDNIQEVVEDCIPTTLIKRKSTTKWIQLISSEHLQGSYNNGRQRAEKVKGELVNCARQQWPLSFSRFYQVSVTSGPALPRASFFVAVNWYGVFFMNGKETKLLELPYIEINDVRIVSESKTRTPSVSLDTIRGKFVLKCDEAAEMEALIEELMNGLRRRSVYALALQDVNKPHEPKFLVCRRGDLLLVEEDKHSSLEYNQIRATNQRTRSSGLVLRDTVQFLPTLSRPSEEVLELLIQVPRRVSVEETLGPATLKEFALENFRPVVRDGGRQGSSREVSNEKLWIHSKEPLDQPLLKSLVHKSDLSNLACKAFIAILKYMGDYPVKNALRPVKLTEQIFGPATQNKALQDEIYCQIMKQMTDNNNRLSLERGWQLLWLCSGLFPPSHDLMGHAQRFLTTRLRDPLADDCLQRQKEMRSKKPRKFPPHQEEVDAIQKNNVKTSHKIYFPNDTTDIFVVTSTSTVKDVCNSIASRLRLNSADRFGLYLQTPNKVQWGHFPVQVTHLEEQNYFFDSLVQNQDTPKKEKKVKEDQIYQVTFVKKLWHDVIPGENPVEDNTFHFPQEVSKYLQGKHDCTREDMINLGGLLLRVKVDFDKSQFDMIPKMLKNLVPEDQIKSMSPEEWKKHIISSYNKHSGLTAQECKTNFLRAISSWPTFGCAFFEVRQTSDLRLPYTLMVVISQEGFNVRDPKTKALLISHLFRSITDFRSKGDNFQVTAIMRLEESTFVCETSLASSIEDIIKLYMSVYEKQKQDGILTSNF